MSAGEESRRTAVAGRRSRRSRPSARSAHPRRRGARARTDHEESWQLAAQPNKTADQWSVQKLALARQPRRIPGRENGRLRFRGRAESRHCGLKDRMVKFGRVVPSSCIPDADCAPAIAEVDGVGVKTAAWSRRTGASPPGTATPGDDRRGVLRRRRCGPLSPTPIMKRAIGATRDRSAGQATEAKPTRQRSSPAWGAPPIE